MSQLGDFKIIPAQKNDVEEIYELEQTCFSSDQFSKRRFLYLITKAESDFVVIRKKKKIIAYLIILKRKNTKQLRIYSLAISPEARGLGLAKMLLEYSEKLAQKNSIEKISLEVNVNNPVAINLYKTKGYQAIGVKENYYSDGSNALEMIKVIQTKSLY